MRKSLYIALSAVALLLASAASYAIASSTRVPSASRTTTIRACKNKRTGALYIKARCRNGYTRVVWNVRGPAGPAGPAGPRGANGTNGTNGTNGAPGAAATVSVGATSTGAPGSSASVTNAGTSSAAKLNFTVPQGATGATGPAGAAGPAGVAGTSPWSKPTVMNSGSGATSGSITACPYSPSTSTATGNPATALDFNGSTYVYTGATCKLVYPAVNTADDHNTPDVDPSDWTELAAAGQNGTADAWAFIDPGVCADGGACTKPVISSGGVAGAGVSFNYLTVGQYRLDVTGCPAADTPASGQPFPLAVTVTPEGAYSGESSNDSSVINVVDSVRNTTSLGVLGGLGVAEFYVDLGTPSTTTLGQVNGIDEPFSVSIDC